ARLVQRSGSPLFARRADVSFRSPVPIAVAMKTVVGPAMTLADRGAPERLAPDSPDYATDHRAGRPGDQKAGSGAGHRPDRIGLRCRSSDCPDKNYRRQ